MSLIDKTAIVTGAAHGLGKAVARLMVERGARVVLADFDRENGEAAALELGSAARFFHLDVWEEEQWIEAVAFTKASFGGYDVLVNNAAIHSLTSIEKVTKTDCLRVLQTNVGGVILGCKFAILSMKEGTGGSIINVSSNSSLLGFWQVPIYSASKGAVNALTKAIVAHCRHEKLPIRCNTVIPGGMVSNMTRKTFMELAGIDIESGTAEAAAVVSANNMVSPDQVAEAILFLASDAGQRLNGAEVLVDGGDASIFTQS